MVPRHKSPRHTYIGDIYVRSMQRTCRRSIYICVCFFFFLNTLLKCFLFVSFFVCACKTLSSSSKERAHETGGP